MNNKKPNLILIQSTDSPIHEHLAKGIWSRQEFTLKQYAKDFTVCYYTCDSKNFQHIMPSGVKHCNGKVASDIFGIRHILYYFFLLFSSFYWRKKNAVVRVVGVNVPVIPLLKIISGKKIVLSYQFDWAHGMKKDYKGIKPIISAFVQRFVINSADHLICTTQWLADIAMTRYKKKYITIIPNYVNTDVFKPSSEMKKQIVFAGRLHWSKGIDVLINAFKQFSKSFSEYKLYILGIGEEENKLKQLAEGNEKIIFTGALSNTEVAKIFNESEIFVLPTINMEGHPKALVEAMAAGCKCIASDVLGNNNVLIESESEYFLFDSKDENELCNKLIFAVHNNTHNQYLYALSHYPADICFKKEIALLKQILVK